MSPTPIKPVPGYILVEQVTDTAANASTNLVFSTDENSYGSVVAIGDPLVNDWGNSMYCPVNAGDQIVYDRMAKMNIMHEGKAMAFIRFRDVLGVINATK